MKMTWKTVSGIVGATLAGIVIMLSATMMAYPAISSLAGLAVAQSATQWNNVRDAAVGDNLTDGIFASGLMIFDGTNFDRARGDTTNGLDVDVTRMPGGAFTPADATANPTGLQGSEAFNMAFNGTTWDRIRTATADALASTGIQTGNLSLFNGTTFDRQDGASNTNNTSTTSVGIALTTPATTWFTVPNTTAAAATAATVSRAAGGGTVRHVVTGVTMCFHDSAINTVARLVNLRDGATGAGTIIKSWYLSNGGVAGGAQCEDIPGLNISGSANTAMTLEFAAAPAATASETVSFQGYSTP